MNKFLIITAETVSYAKTGTEAALVAGHPKWATLGAAAAINALAPGDELDLDDNTSVIRLTGKNETFAA